MRGHPRTTGRAEVLFMPNKLGVSGVRNMSAGTSSPGRVIAYMDSFDSSVGDECKEDNHGANSKLRVPQTAGPRVNDAYVVRTAYGVVILNKVQNSNIPCT